MRPVDPELCTRTSWVDAKAAYKLVTTVSSAHCVIFVSSENPGIALNKCITNPVGSQTCSHSL